MAVTEKIARLINDRQMISSGDTVITGLSGGADSVCLLIALNELSPVMSFTLRAVHVNHCIRGEESDRDELFCRDLCIRLGIPLEVFSVNVPEYAAQTGLSTEEAARSLRYGCFERAAHGQCCKIATAHNLCDNAETMLFNLTRGTGIKGMKGIPHIRGNIIRPLIGVTRNEIEDYLNQHGQQWVTDSTNLTEDYSRNKIRHRVIPALLEINSGFYSAAQRLSESAAEDEQYFTELLSRLSPEDMPSQPPSVRKRFIRQVLSQAGAECSAARLSELDCLIREKRNGRICIRGDIFAEVRKGVLSAERCIKPACENICITLEKGFSGEYFIPEIDKTVKITRVCDDNLAQSSIIHRKLTNNSLNYVKIQGVAVIRNKRDGDSIRFAKREHTTKLKKHYNALGLTPAQRACALVIEDEQGIIWSEYGGAAQRVFPDDDTQDIIEITVVRR